MSVNNISETQRKMNSVERKLMYKSHGQWAVKTTGTIALGALAAVAGAGNVTAHADTVSPVVTQSTSTLNETVSTSTQNQQATTVSLVITQANTTVNQAVITSRPSIVAGGGSIESMSPQVVNQSNVANVTTEAQNQAANISAVGSADSAMMSAITSGASATSAMGGSYIPQSAQDVTGWNQQQIDSVTSKTVANLDAVGNGNSLQLSAASANGQNISNASGLMKPGSTMDVSSLSPEEIASITSRAAAILSATGSADSQLTSASQTYTSAINAVGGQLKRSEAINTADGMTVDQITSMVKSQIVGISQTASADVVIRSVVQSALPGVNNIGGIMSAGSTIDATTLDPASLASMVAHQQAMVSATASGDIVISDVVNVNKGNINAAGGTITVGSHVNTADNMTVDQIMHLVESQIANVSATGSVDGVLAPLISEVQSAASQAGITLKSGQNIDVSSMTPEEIQSLGQSLVNNYKNVAGHDEMINSAVPAVSGVVTSAGGKMTPGSVIDATNWTPEKIASETKQQSEMISATGSADADVKSNVDSATPDINGAGGHITQSGTVNTANNMTVSEVASHVASQDAKISETASADRVIGKVVSDNAGVISNADGVEKPGKEIDTTGLTSDQINSMVAHQQAMVSATGSADADVKSNVDSATGDITKVGGSITQSGTVNTADNWTVSEIANHVVSQDAKISETASADRGIDKVVNDNSKAISNANGIEKPGSSIDTTNLTSEQINSMVAYQQAMVSATGSADTAIKKHADSVSSVINGAGGTIIQSGTINTADNWTPEEIASHEKAQEQRIDAVASADAGISEAVVDNASAISAVSGVEKPGKAIDATSMTPEQINSMVANQEAMVSATGSADADIKSNVDSAIGDIINAGGTIKQSGTVNTADNMTVSQVASHVASQDAKISETASADRGINKAVNDNSQAISNANGIEKPGSAVDTTNLTSEQINSMVKHQEVMVSATGSADAAIKSHADDAASTITGVGGTITQSGTINTADNWTPEEIASHEHVQEQRIDAVKNADAGISKAVSDNANAISAVSGVEKLGKAIDATSMTPEQINSMVAHQEAMVSATGSADADIKSNVDSATGDITNAGGTIIQSGTVNTADNMTVSEVASHVLSQDTKISETASADRGIYKVVTDNASAISAASGIEKPGSVIDTTSLTSDQINSMVAHQEAMVSATGSADASVKSHADDAASTITGVGGRITQSGTINTADNWTPEEIASREHVQEQRIDAVKNADAGISKAVSDNANAISAVSGVEKPGKAIDATSMTPEQINSMVANQEAMVSATGSADVQIKNDVDSATPVINGAGGHIIQSGTVNTANNMTVSEVASHVASQDAKISETASADRVIGKVISDNAGVISNAGGVEKPGEEIDTTGLTSDQINSMVAHQQAMVSATGSADADVKSNVDSATPDINGAGGHITQSGTVNTANNMTVSEVASHVASQDAKISETASADRGIDKVVNDNSKAISNANGIEKPGSSIDTTNLTSEQINSMVAYQQAMVSATGSADTAIKNHADSVSSVINGAGGTITQFGTINTADNWTPEEIASHERAQEQRIDAVASADAGISEAVVDNASAISAVSGVEKPGKAIDATSMTPEQINSMVANQEAMVNATGSADADVKSNVDSATGDITNVGGTIKQSGTVNTADNMTVSQVASHVASQDAKVSETASADRGINKVANDNSQAISNANGIEKPGSAIDTTNLTSEQINLMVAHQEAMVSATGSADAAIKSHADNAASTITGVGGTITQSGTINTADNWTPEEIASHEHAQEQRIDAVKNADAGISKVVSDNASVISAVSGVEKPGKAIDATSMTPEQINSMVAHQEAMVSATGSADADIKSNVDSATGDITNAGGTLTQSGTVNTADNMTVSEVVSHVLSQDTKISETASADRGIHKVVTDNASAISAASGVEKPGSAIDTTSLTSDQINSMVAHQEAMVSATGSADAAVKSHADNAASTITGAGGTIIQSGTVNTADNWTVDQVASHEHVQEQRIDAVKNADAGISKAVSDNASAISAVNGVEKPGKAIDATSMTPDQINSMVAHQEAMVSATGSADVQIKNDVDSATSDITTAGGTINQSGTVNTADNMTVSEIASHVTSQGAKISETASADRGIHKVVIDNASAISAANGVEKPGSAIDTTSLTSEQISSMVVHQEAMVSATGSADADVKSHVDSATNDITKIGGHITQSGTINTADNMTVDQIKSNVVSQDAKIEATASADRGIASVVAKNSGAIAAISGIEKAGSELDATSMTLSDVASIVAHQEAMVNATGSADSELLSLVNAVSSAINMNHGFVTPSGSVNTADNMTVEQIQSAVKAQMERINAVNNADTSLANMLKNDSDAIFGSKIKAGSAVDVTAKNPEQIKALADSQAAMISQTIANNVLLSNAESVAKSAVAAVGGKLVKGSNIDVTGKTVSEIASLASQQASVLSAVQTVDGSLASALTKSNEVTKAGGTITRGVDINAASMTAIDIIAAGETQAANVAATVSGDAIINNALTRVWSQTVTRGSSIDVSSMTPAQIASLTASESDAIGETQNANEQLSEAVARTSQSIHEIGGKTITVSVKQTEGLTSDQIGSSAASQTGKLDETATANDLDSSAIAAHRGVVMSSVAAVNTTNMDSQTIVSEVHSQVDHIAHTDSMNSDVVSQVAVQNPMVTGAGGQLTKSGIFDTTSMTEDAMTSWTNSESAHLSHVGSNDKALTDTLNASHANLTLLQGSAVSSVAIDVTNKTDAEIDSLMNSQITLISQAASANVVMDSERASAIAAGVKVSIAQQSLRSKQEIDTLMASTASALTSAVTVASESKAVTKAVDSYNAVMDAFLAQYQQAGGNPLDTKWVEIDAGQDASHVVSQANSLLGSLSTENSKAQASLSIATETMNYIKNEVQDSLAILTSKAQSISHVNVTTGPASQVHNLGDIELNWKEQVSSANQIIDKGNKYNLALAEFVTEKSDAMLDSLKTLVAQARAVGVNVSSSVTSTVDDIVDPLDDSSINDVRSEIDADYRNQITQVSNAIALQKQYDQQYSAKSNSIATSYQNAMTSYTAKSNATVVSNQTAQNSYNQAMNNYRQESTAVSQANADAQDSYNSAKANYDYLKSLYDSQISEQQSITQHSIAISDAIKNAYSAAPAAYATNVQFSYEVLGSSIWNNDQVTYNHSHTVKMIDAMNIGEKKLDFDINVSGLKAGDKIHVMDLTMSSNNHQWDGLNDFMFLTRSLPFRINGEIYGYLQCNSYWGQNQNGGDQSNVSNPYGSRNNNTTPHATHELYIVMTKDYHGVGNQHVSFDSETKNDLSEFNLEVGPSVFDTASGDINATLTATDHDGNILNTTHFTFTRPTNKNDWNNGNPSFEDEHGVWMGDGQPHLAGFTNVLVTNQYDDRWNTFTTSNAKYNIQNNYEFGGTYSRTGQTLTNQMKPGDHGDRAPIDLGFETFDQDGRPLSGFRTVAASNSVFIPWRNVEYGLTVDQLKAKLDPNKSEIIYSYNPNNNSYSWVANVTKSFIQGVTKPILSSKENLLKRYPAWAWRLLVPANQQGKAIQNTIDFYNSHEWMPTHIGFWLGNLDLVNPNELDTLTGHIYSLNDPGGMWHDDYTGTEQNPYSLSLISGQAGLHVHYVDSNGVALRQNENNIDSANKTVEFTVESIPGYTLDATNAKIPAGAQTIEKSGSITYPGDGQWKDVYVVYKPFVPTGGLTPPTPPTLQPGSNEPPAPNMTPAPTKPTKETVNKDMVSVSYHPNKARVKPINLDLRLHSYYDNDRIQPIKAKNTTNVPEMTVTSADPIYAALSSHYPDVKTNYHAYDTNLIQNFNYQYKPMSTQYHVYNDEGGYNPEDYNYSPVGTTYARYDTDGTNIPSTIDDPKNPGHKISNPKFTGYTPWSTTWSNYSTDGTNIPPMIEDPTNPGYLVPNPKFTGYTPWSTTWQNYSTDGTNIPPMIPDPNHPGKLIPNPKFTGYTPWSTTWKNYSTDGTDIPPMIEDPKNPGHLIPNPKFTGYTPWSTTWKNYSTDGTDIPPMIEDPKNPGHLIPNPKFTGYTLWSTTWQSYSTDGTNIPPMIEDPKNPGHYISNPKFTGYTPWSTTWQSYSTDGTKIPPMIPDPNNPGKLISNPKFTGYTPWSTTWRNYSTDGTDIPPMISDPNHPGKLIPNPKFTGYTPWSTTWKNYSTDGTNIPPMIEDPKNPGHLIPNPKFTGYTPWSTTWKNYSTDGTNIPPMIEDPKNPGHLIPNPKFTGYTPWSTTWKNYSTDGTNIPPMIEDPKNPGHLIPNPKFTGYTPWSTTWQSYSTDGTKIPPMIPDPNNPGKLIPNPKFTGYTPWSTTWQSYSTDGTNIPPMIEDPKNSGHYIPNPEFTGYTPWSTTWQSYSTDGTKIPPMIPDPNNPGHLIPNPKFTGYTPWSTTWQNYSTDGTKIPPMIPDPNNPGHLIPNPKFTGYTPWSTTWQNYSTDGTKIPPMIPDPNNPGKLIPNPKFTGYTPWSTTWQNYSSDGKAISKDVPSVIPDPNNPGHYIKNPKFTGYAPMTTEKRALSTMYDVLDSDGSKIPPMIPDGHGGYIPNPKFTGYAPFGYTYRPFSDDGSKVPSMIPDGHGGFKPNPNFTGYAPLSTKYTPLSVKYHNYQAAPEAPQPVQPAPAPAQPVPAPSVAASVAPVPLAAPQVPAQPALVKPALPQTGRAHSLIALVGLAGLAAVSMMSLAGVNKRKHEAQ